MADELNQKEISPEAQPGDQNPPEVAGLGQSAVSEVGVAELESMIAPKKGELVKAKTLLI